MPQKVKIEERAAEGGDRAIRGDSVVDYPVMWWAWHVALRAVASGSFDINGLILLYC